MKIEGSKPPQHIEKPKKADPPKAATSETKPPQRPAGDTGRASEERFASNFLRYNIERKPFAEADTSVRALKGEAAGEKAGAKYVGFKSADQIEREQQAQLAKKEAADHSPEDIKTAEAAAKKVEEAYLQAQHQCATGSGSPALDAAAKLEEVTRGVSPEVAALIIEKSQPTIDKIAKDLGSRAKTDDGDYGSDKLSDQIFTKLAAATNRAALAPNGKEVVSKVAASIVENIGKENIGRFDEAIGKAIGKGAGAELSIEIINQLSAAGRTGQADDILQNVKDGVNELKDRISKSSEKVQELGWLIQQWAPMMTEEQLGDAIEKYKEKNPEAAQALKDLNELGAAAVRTLSSLSELPPGLNGLGNADDVKKSLQGFAADPKVISAISQSPEATAAIGLLMEKKPEAFEKMIGVLGNIDDGIGPKEFANVLLKKAMDFSIDGIAQSVEAKNTASAKAFLKSLELTAKNLGFTHHKMDDAFKNLEKAIDAKTTRQFEEALYGLGKNIDKLEELKILSPESGLGTRMRGMGLLIGGIGLGISATQLANDPNLKNTVSTLSEAVGLGSGLKFFEQFKSIQKLGKVAGGLSIALDALSVGQNLAKGDYANAGFGAASAVGGALLTFGSGLAATGIGAVLVGGALIGAYFYNRSKEGNKHETDGARAFLEGAGINKELANQLINNDDKGRSPARVLTALAEKLNVDPKEFFEYLSKLSPKDAKRLMETAHGVDPNDEGIFPADKENRRYAGRGGGYTDPSPNDLNDLEKWMRENGFEDAPGL